MKDLNNEFNAIKSFSIHSVEWVEIDSGYYYDSKDTK